MKVYLIAICGTGMSALAGLFKEKGYDVAGSDLAMYPPVSDLIHELKIPVKLAYDVDHLKEFNPDIVVIGNFVRKDNPQAQYVLENKIPYYSMASALEEIFLQKTHNLVVAGTHGKTTTVSALSTILHHVGAEPGFFVGGIAKNFKQSFALGAGKYFVLEGDEYDSAFFDKESKFLHYRPSTLVLMALEFDHADIFDSVEKIEAMFDKLLTKCTKGALVLYASGWPRLRSLIERAKKNNHLNLRFESFGFEADADHRIEKFYEGPEGLSFSLQGTMMVSKMAGAFNALNLSGAFLAAKSLGLDTDKLVEGVRHFEGVKRRQEVRAEVRGHLVLDDFGHHPTAVKQVLTSLKARYPGHRVVAFFEPRSNTTRRNIFQNELADAFVPADATLLPEVFRPETLADNERLSIPKIIEHLRSMGRSAFGPLSTSQLVEHALAESQKGPCAFVVLSNGAFDGLHEKLISGLKSL